MRRRREKRQGKKRIEGSQNRRTFRGRPNIVRNNTPEKLGRFEK